MRSLSMDLQKSVRARRSRITWTSFMDQTLVELLLENVERDGKSGLSFDPSMTRDLVERFSTRTMMEVEAYQLQNRIKFYRREFKMARELQKLPGFRLDEKKQRIIGDDASWNRYFLKKPPPVKYYRYKNLAPFKDLEVIFGPIYGMHNSSSSAQDIENAAEDIIEGVDRSEGSEESKQFLEFTSTPDCLAPSLNTFIVRAQTADFHSTQSPSTSTTKHAAKERFFGRRDGPGHASNVKHAGKRSRCKQDETMITVARAFEDKHRTSLGSNGIKSVDECMVELNAMDDLDDEVYVKALFILRDEYNRCVFLNTSGHRRLAWLQAVTRHVDV